MQGSRTIVQMHSFGRWPFISEVAEAWLFQKSGDLCYQLHCRYLHAGLVLQVWQFDGCLSLCGTAKKGSRSENVEDGASSPDYYT